MSSPSLPIILAPEAQDDIEAIRLYTLQEWGEEQERVYATALYQALMLIGENPAIGRRRDELRAGIRSHIVRQHIVYYRIGEQAVIVLRVLHGRLDSRRAFRGGR